MDSLDYLRGFIEYTNDILEKIEKESAGRDDIQPFIEPETGRFIAFMVQAMNAVKVLELGTGIGNSAIWIGQALAGTGGKLTTVDNHPRTRHEALKNINDAGMGDIVTCVDSDAEEFVDKIMQEGKGSFDIVFQDCGKYLYPVLHDRLASLLRPGGLIIADDTLFHVNPEVRRNLGKYTDEYNRLVFQDKRFFSAIIPVGHGLTLSVLKQQKH